MFGVPVHNLLGREITVMSRPCTACAFGLANLTDALCNLVRITKQIFCAHTHTYIHTTHQ